MDDYWRDHMTNRGTDKLNLTLTTQPLGAPIMARADWRTPGKAPGSDLASLQRDALDAFGSRMAIAHCVPHRPGLLQRGYGGNRLPGAKQLHRT